MTFDVARPWSMIDGLAIGLYLVEFPSGQVRYANPRFLQLAGLEALEELIRRGEATHSHVLHALAASDAQAFFPTHVPPSGEPRSGQEEGLVELANGRTLRRLSTPARDAAGRVLRQLYLFEDITERMRTEQALRRSEQSFRRVIENAPEAIFIHGNHRFIYVNPMLLKALRYEHPSELIGQDILTIVHPDDRKVVRQRIHSAADLGELAPLRELRYLRRDGTWFDVESTGVPVEFDGVKAVVVMARDVSERKQMQAQLLQTDRLSMVGTLAAGVGHEINNPLSYVQANLALALESMKQLAQERMGAGAGGPEAQRWTEQFAELETLLQEAHEGALRVRNIVRDLKSFSRQEEEERRTAVDVREPLGFSLKMAASELRHRAQLITKYEPVPPVHADASRLGQVFLNLLINAAQALPEERSAHNTITLWVRLDASGRVAVDVSDTGAGMPPEVLARIFDPFFTTKPVGKGTGLGLSICHGIIRDLGGEISVRSEVGRGTTFTVLLPPMRPAAAAGAPSPGSPTSRSERRGRLLIIDDEPLVARSLSRIIGRQHQVVVVVNSQEGLAQLTFGEPFDVIFCDLMMPGLTGMDLYEQVLERRPELAPRFVFITGGSYTPRARRFLETVPNTWLEKPFDVQHIQRLIAKALETS
ncbi:PAS domain S-box protein [Archangium violaceum]|uniref:hybrid sensor histidine kinase/response regulator n=1 Tax=Archangium violaceum TaxID=83451 RepID=UPI002B27E80A|nr:PAS domain S-box protein [Archangium gephyra]